MAQYVPADAIMYLEFNSLPNVAKAIQQSDAWKATSAITGTQPSEDSRITSFAALAGIGPTAGVIFTRAQVALAVIRLNQTEEDNTLKIKPDVALIVETHTSKWRNKAFAVDAVKRLASMAYGQSTCTERSAGADFVECSIPGGDRKVIGAVDGSLVVIGNSDQAVQSVLEVRRGARPSMRTDPELEKVRRSVTQPESLGFGYISQTNSAKLFSWAAPLMMGRGPGDQQLEQLLASSAAKILRGVAWTALPSKGGIEDRFQISFDQGFVERLQPAFDSTAPDEKFWQLVPNTTQSLTIYQSKQPATAWSSLDSAVSFKLEAVPAVLFGSILRSSLAVYGIEKPKEVLTSLAPPLVTLKPSPASESSILIARVANSEQLRRSLTSEIFKENRGQIYEGLSYTLKSEKEFSAVLFDGYIILGKTDSVQSCLDSLNRSQAVTNDPNSILRSAASENSAAVVTFSNDEARLNSFMTMLLSLEKKRLTAEQDSELQKRLRKVAYSVTETRLNDGGIERRTHSNFGQFSTLMSLLQSGSSNSIAH